MTDITPISEAELLAAVTTPSNELDLSTPPDDDFDLEAGGPHPAGDDPIILPAPGYSQLPSFDDSDDEEIRSKPVDLAECLSAYCTKETLSGELSNQTPVPY